MAATTWIEVADSAVKIGLGGLVAGTSAWLVAHLNAQRAIDRLKFERRSAILQEVAKVVEEHRRIAMALINKRGSLAQARQRLTTEETKALPTVVAEVNEEIARLRAQLNEHFHQVMTVQAQLLLLAEHKASEALAQFLVPMSEVRDFSWAEDQDCLEDLSSRLICRILDARTALFDCLSEAFQRS